MALGGGTFVSYNKVLPGTYINIVSPTKAGSVLSLRGVVTMPMSLHWGPELTVVKVTRSILEKQPLPIFGCAYDDGDMKPIREVFRHADTLYLFRLNSSGVKATCTYADAKYSGTYGNNLKIVIVAGTAANTYDVSTYLGTVLVDKQVGVSSASALADNDFVDWKDNATLAVTAGTSLTGGTDGSVGATAYQTYLDAMESYSFNAMGCTATDDTTKALFVSYVTRQRDDVGKKFQVVLFNKLADYEGVVSVKNTISSGAGNPALVPWVLGVIGGVAVSQSATNMKYDGEYTPNTAYTQAQLEAAILEGSFAFHSVDGEVRVLEDVNTFVTATESKSREFSFNQTIRVLDQIATDIAVLFNTRYLGKIPNDKDGRASLWNDIVKHHSELAAASAITDFSSENVSVLPGETRRAVIVQDAVTPAHCMEQLYMTLYVS